MSEQTHSDKLAVRIAQTMLAREGTGPAWGVELLACRVGYAKVAMRLRADMLNGHKTAHGGMIFALADTAFAYACNSENNVTVAQAASISFLAPAHEGDQLIAEAQKAANAGRSGVYDVRVTTCNGEIIAIFQGLSRALGRTVINCGADE